MNKRAREDKFAGAYVQDPIQGRHEWVYDLDITSMYPSVIRSLNISPDTKIGKVVGWDSKEFIKKDNKKTYTIEQNKKEMGKFTETELSKAIQVLLECIFKRPKTGEPMDYVTMRYYYG